MKEIKLCGVRIDNLSLSDAVIYALQRKSRPCFTVTPNAVMLDACKREPRYAAILNTASLSLPDGCGVLWAARRKGTPLRERVAGIEFGEAVLQAAANKGLRVFLLGGKRGIARYLYQRLLRHRARLP
jgi:N-acetylglucosaminyldiphosphoundecaprenol N-acetyl-beta-D-mannosaminyltransferase